jgi:hypothetical protein
VQQAVCAGIAQAAAGATANVVIGWTPEALQQLGLMVIEQKRNAERENALRHLGGAVERQHGGACRVLPYPQCK